MKEYIGQRGELMAEAAAALKRANERIGGACVQGSPDVALAPELEWLPELVTEVCPHCESEVTLGWDVEERGYKAFCPVCGGRLMLCDECQHRGPGGEHTGDCDYNAETDSCRFNPPEVESL